MEIGSLLEIDVNLGIMAKAINERSNSPTLYVMKGVYTRTYLTVRDWLRRKE